MKNIKCYPNFFGKNLKDMGHSEKKRTRKWFAIIMNVDKSRIVPEEKGIVEVLNVKLGDQTASLLKEKRALSRFS